MIAVCKYIIESANIYQVDGQILAKLVTNLSWPVGSGWSGGTAKLTIGVSQSPSTAVLLWPSLTCTSHCFALVWCYINETNRLLWITLWKTICVSSCAMLFNSINLAGWDNMGLCVPLLNFVFRLCLPNGNMPTNKKIAKRGIRLHLHRDEGAGIFHSASQIKEG